MDTQKVEARIQMIGTKISELEIKNDFVSLNIYDEELKKKIDISYKLSEPFKLEKKYPAQSVSLFIKVNLKNDDGETNINLELEGCFRANESDDPDALSEYISTNGVAALYSITRGTMLSITSLMCTNGGGVVLPMINVFSLNEKQKAEKEEDK